MEVRSDVADKARQPADSSTSPNRAGLTGHAEEVLSGTAPSAVAALPGVAAGPVDPDHPDPTTTNPNPTTRPRDAHAKEEPLGRRLSRSLMPDLTLVQSTEAHPPPHAHAHFDLSEHDDESTEREKHEPRHRGTDHEQDHQMGGSGNGNKRGVVDIEHVPVDDDPREWSNGKKNFVLGLLTISVLGPLIAPSIYNPVIDDVMQDLSASETEIGLSISLYILFQGCIPVLWASIAEITGRKIVYLSSYAIYLVGAVVASRATNMPLFITMRCIQACGSSAVVAVGAGSLADMYEVHERGQKLGLFYGMPLVGPAIGPLIGGALGNASLSYLASTWQLRAFGWRAALYFLAVYAFVCLLLFLFFPDTWRRERSRVYQKAMERAVRRAIHQDEVRERKRARKAAKGLPSNAPTPPTTGLPTPEVSRRGSFTSADAFHVHASDAERARLSASLPSHSHSHSPRRGPGHGPAEASSPSKTSKPSWIARLSPFAGRRHRSSEGGDAAKIQPGWRDINPFPTMWSIFHQPTNAVVLAASGILFAAQYTIVYTAAITLAKGPYSYNALHIGLVLLTFGLGNMVGSIGGGKYSDVVLRKLKERNGGVSAPEMRLKAVIPAAPFVVGSFLAYGWVAEKEVHIAAIVVFLFIAGSSLMLIYAGTLAYLVDSNPGRSAGAVSCNSFVRGSLACVLSQVAIPIQNAIGDGGLYSIFAGLLALSCFWSALLAFRGESWRDPSHTWPWTRRKAVADPEKA